MLMGFGRVLRTGLSRLCHLTRMLGFGPSCFHPSRVPHEWQPFEIGGYTTESDGIIFHCGTRRGNICARCGATDIMPPRRCIEGKYFSR